MIRPKILPVRQKTVLAPFDGLGFIVALLHRLEQLLFA